FPYTTLFRSLQLEDPQPVLAPLVETIEKPVAETAADNHADRAIKNQVANHVLVPAFGATCTYSAEPPGTEEAGEVSQSIPVHRQRANGKGNGINLGKSQHKLFSPTPVSGLSGKAPGQTGASVVLPAAGGRYARPARRPESWWRQSPPAQAGTQNR